ncbi:MAG TPA: hypothetical protein VLH79_10750 [Chthonomonadales bacterium]|nr:hypothetical protein [Chthonomonadales bacterium]
MGAPRTEWMLVEQGAGSAWGEYERALDDKCRLVVPAELRSALGRDVVLTRGPDAAILLFAADDWRRIERQLVGAPAGDEHALLQRMLFGRTLATLDRQHRVTLPAPLRHWAGIEAGSVATVIGLGRKVEVWERGAWQRYAAGFTRERVAAAVRGAGLGELWGL